MRQPSVLFAGLLLGCSAPIQTGLSLETIYPGYERADSARAEDATISLTVRGPRGELLSGASVNLRRHGHTSLGRPHPTATYQVDSTGRVTVVGVAPGCYWLLAIVGTFDYLLPEHEVCLVPGQHLKLRAQLAKGGEPVRSGAGTTTLPAN